jgi:hypothetical protein
MFPSRVSKIKTVLVTGVGAGRKRHSRLVKLKFYMLKTKEK